MVDTVVEALILDLPGFASEHDRRYEEVIDAWRTSCRRLPVGRMQTIGGLSCGCS
jgi:hypothetical protein